MSFARVDPAHPHHPPSAGGLPPIPEKVVVHEEEYRYSIDDPTAHYTTVSATPGVYDHTFGGTLQLLGEVLLNQLPHSANETWARFSSTPLYKNVYNRFDTHLSRLRMPPVVLKTVAPYLPDGLHRLAHHTTAADGFMTVAIIIAMLMQLRSKRLWHQMDMFLKLGLGVMCFALPHLSLRAQVNSPRVDAIDLHVTRMVGALMLGFAVMDYRLRNVVLRDARIAYDIAAARFMAMLLALMSVIYVHSASDSVWNHRHALWAGALLGVHVVGDLMHILQSEHAGQVATRRTFLNVHLGIDHVLTFLVGVMWFAFPIWTLQMSTVKSNYVAVSSHVAHFIGALYLYWSLLGVRTTYWPLADIKRDFVVGRLTTEGLVILSNVLLLLHSDTWGRKLVGHLPWQIGTHALLAGNLLLANCALDIPIFHQLFPFLTNTWNNLTTTEVGSRYREPVKSTRTYYTRGSNLPVVQSKSSRLAVTKLEPALTETTDSMQTSTTTTTSKSGRGMPLRGVHASQPVETWLSTSRSPSPVRRQRPTSLRRTKITTVRQSNILDK